MALHSVAKAVTSVASPWNCVAKICWGAAMISMATARQSDDSDGKAMIRMQRQSQAKLSNASEGLSGVRNCRGNETQRQDCFEMQRSSVVGPRRATAPNSTAKELLC